MSQLSGNLKSLKASQKQSLEKLGSRRSNAHQLINPELANKASKVATELGLMVGLILARDGKVTHVVLGSKDRIYLPDLGRFRLSAGRLRRLRLIIFLPTREGKLKKFSNLSFLAHRGKAKEKVLSPVITDDLITDLEKLRFDTLAVIAPEANGNAGPVSFAYLEPRIINQSSIEGRVSQRIVQFQHVADLYRLNFDFEAFVSDLEDKFRAQDEELYEVGKERVLLVGAYTGPAIKAKSSMEELAELARTAGLQIVDTITQRRKSLDPKTLIGKGKLEDIVLHCLDLGADIIVFDRELSPTQLRNITNLTELRIIDRSMLILDIFAQRAKSSEGRLQVELAQLKYSLPRLTETDSGLSRLTGGIGGRGPGETKLEIGRRRARDRITRLEKQIKKVASQRELRRQRRKSRGVPVIGIVGYTNAGKSTLLNSLTKGEVLVESKLFATLDPSTRRMRFPNDKEVVFVDTVGFIRELPKELIFAFRATLEEIGEADVLVHVVDASSPELAHQMAVVEKTLEDLNYGDKPKILVLNKSDLLSGFELSSLVSNTGGLAVSALKRTGFEELIQILQEELADNFEGRDPGSFIADAS